MTQSPRLDLPSAANVAPPAPVLPCADGGIFSPIISTSTETDEQRAAREAYDAAQAWYDRKHEERAYNLLQKTLAVCLRVGA